MTDSGNYQQKNLKPDFSAALEKARPRYRRRYDDNGPEEKGMIWLITFTDTMGLMLAFFVMMFSMSVPKQKDFSEVMAAMNSELNPFYGQAQNAGPEDGPDLDRIQYNTALDLSYLKALMRAVIEKEPVLKDNIALTQQGDSLYMSLPQALLFDTGQAALKDASARPLFTLGGTFSRMKNKIDLVGHAAPRTLIPGEDSVYKTNWELSLARAASVAAALDKVGYTDPVTIRGAGDGRYGDLDGIVDKNERLDLSRRVDIVIMNHDGKSDRVFAD